MDVLVAQEMERVTLRKKLKRGKVGSKFVIFCDFSEECSARGGQQDGSCAAGFGTCCICKILGLLTYFVNFILILCLQLL